MARDSIFPPISAEATGQVISLLELMRARKGDIARTPFMIEFRPEEWCLHEPSPSRPWSGEEMHQIARDLREAARILDERAHTAAGKEPDMVLADIQIFETSHTTFWMSNRIETPEQFEWMCERLDACKTAHLPKSPAEGSVA